MIPRTPEAREGQFEGLARPGSGRVLDEERDDTEREQKRPGDPQAADFACAQIG